MRYKRHQLDPLARELHRGRFCAHCRKPYTPTAGHQKYCGHRCRSAAHRARHRVRTRICAGCSCAYLVVQTGSPGPRSEYHSEACRHQAYRRRRKAREALARHSQVGEVGYEVDNLNRTWRITRTWWGVDRQLLPGTGRPPGGTKVPD